MPNIVLSTGKEFEICAEKYSDYMEFLENVFRITDDVAAEKDTAKAKIKMQIMETSLFSLEKRYQDGKLKKCVIKGDLDGLTILESRELLQAIDELSKPKIEEKN